MDFSGEAPLQTLDASRNVAATMGDSINFDLLFQDSSSLTALTLQISSPTALEFQCGSGEISVFNIQNTNSSFGASRSACHESVIDANIGNVPSDAVVEVDWTETVGSSAKVGRSYAVSARLSSGNQVGTQEVVTHVDQASDINSG